MIWNTYLLQIAKAYQKWQNLKDHERRLHADVAEGAAGGGDGQQHEEHPERGQGELGFEWNHWTGGYATQREDDVDEHDRVRHHWKRNVDK